MSKTIERRTFELRTAGGSAEGEKKKLRGHAAVFNVETDLHYFRELIRPGAFKDSIGKDDIRALFNHDSNLILGRNKAGTLRLSEDEHGLLTEIDPPDTQLGRDLLVSIERGDISQMSFGFLVLTEEWNKLDDGTWMREMKKIQLFDVSPVTYPQYTETDIAVRQAADIFGQRQAADLDIQKRLAETDRRLQFAQILSRIPA